MEGVGGGETREGTLEEVAATERGVQLEGKEELWSWQGRGCGAGAERDGLAGLVHALGNVDHEKRSENLVWAMCEESMRKSLATLFGIDNAALCT